MTHADMARNEVEIRPARLGDAQGISALMSQLGYEVPAAAVRDRLAHRETKRQVLVAVVGTRVAGWAAVSVDRFFVEGFCGHLEGLVVEESERERGIGKRLLDAVEDWTRERGCTELCVLSNVVRERAHAFYHRNGYATVKAQYNFRKRLAHKDQ